MVSVGSNNVSIILKTFISNSFYLSETLKNIKGVVILDGEHVLKIHAEYHYLKHENEIILSYYLHFNPKLFLEWFT